MSILNIWMQCNVLVRRDGGYDEIDAKGNESQRLDDASMGAAGVT